MRNSIKLRNPIMVNGKTIKELSYDTDEISVGLYAAACSKAIDSAKAETFQAKMKETDYTTHLYMGMAAVIAINPEIDFTDLERVKGFDLLSLSQIGSFFIFGKSEEPSDQSESENSLENTADTSTQASATQSECE